MKREIEPLRLAWKKICLSLLFVSLPAWGVYWGFCSWMNYKRSDPQYNIRAIVQTGPQKEALKTVFLAELLDLSCDQPQNLYNFSIEQAQNKILQCPVIKSAQLRKIYPHTLYIDYSVRNPVASIHEYANTGIDEQGAIFPITPFFTPKRLPEFYLGLPSYGTAEVWGETLNTPELQLALQILNFLSKAPYSDLIRVLRVDVANAFSASYGQRQIVLIIEDEFYVKDQNEIITYLFPRILRLTPKNYQSELNHYLLLREKLLEKEISENTTKTSVVKCPSSIIDMRLKGIAYVRS